MRRGTARAFVWVQLRARTASSWDRTPVVVKTTARRPRTVEAGCVLVRVLVVVPEALLHPLEAEAVVTVPGPDDG